MAEADAQDWELAGKLANQVDADSGVLRRARPGRNHDAFRLAPRDFLDGNFVVTMDLDVAAQLAEILRQVIGKRIVVVEQQNHWTQATRPPPATDLNSSSSPACESGTRKAIAGTRRSGPLRGSSLPASRIRDIRISKALAIIAGTRKYKTGTANTGLSRYACH